MEGIKPTKLQELELAYEFVSSSRDFGETFAYVSKRDGSIVYDDYEVSGEPCPVEDIEENDDWVQIPDRMDLDLGHNGLVFRFVNSSMPDDYGNIKAIFGRKGAYSRYKNYLENRGKLEEWYKFEESETRKVLLDWCKANDIPIKE